MKHLLIILSFLLLSSPLFGQSSKPLGVVLPPTVMGNVSDSRKQILLNTLDEEVSKYFDVSPPTNVSSGDLPVVEDVFQLQIVEEDGDTQLSVRWMSGNERKVETILCGGCKTIELNGKLKELVEKLVVEKKEKTVVYKEEIKSSEPNVQGTITLPSGYKYVGELKDGIPNGKGTTTFSSGYKYVGVFKNGVPNGLGTETLPDGSKYVGEFKDIKKHGKGKWNSFYGEEYIGDWKDGIFHGRGKFTFTNEGMFVGKFKDGDMWNGTLYDKNGNIIGKIVNGK